LDAPCSGENLRASERRRSRPVSDRDRQLLQRQQIRLLTSAFQALKPGGQLVYATCSLAPEENEAVLDALLKLYPRQAAIETVDHLGISAPGLTSFNELEFQAEMYRAVRLWPHMYDTSGFFAALISKRDSVSVKVHAPPACSLAEAGLKLISKKEQAGVVSYLLQTYGFDLGALIEQQALVLARR
ncbi:MAG: hypothetical protein GY868_21575, partial [Deltaproteobacteria bacterium]|nr:hypothetical protein [Deltaproteobacteria bacterium]